MNLSSGSGVSRGSPDASSKCSPQPQGWRICEVRLEIGSRPSGATGWASTASASITSGESVFAGTMVPRMWRSSTTTDAVSKKVNAPMEKLDPIAPGEILLEEFMRPHGLTQNRLARDLDVPVARINDIVHARRGITADTALRLAAYFGTTAEFWLNLQTRYDLKVARRTAGRAISK